MQNISKLSPELLKKFEDMLKNPKSIDKLFAKISELTKFHHNDINKYFLKYPLLYKITIMTFMRDNMNLIKETINQIVATEIDLSSEEGDYVFQTAMLLSLALDNGKEFFTELDKFLTEET